MKPHGSIDLRLLQYFLATAEAGGITRAAAVLNIAQPTLSKAIRLLEYQLDVPLFERGPQGVVLTAMGRRLHDHARTIMAQVQDATGDIKRMRTGRAGTVRIGAGPSWVRRFLPEAVAAALAERPALGITVSGGYDETLLQGLSEGELDIVVAELPLDVHGPGFETEVLTEDHLVVCARAGHPLAARPNLSVREVLDSPWVLPTPLTMARRKFEGTLLTLGLPAPERVVDSNSMTFILKLVGCSDALTYTTLSSLMSPERERLCALDVPALGNTRRAGLIVRQPRLLSPAAEYVVAQLRAVSAGHRN